MSFNKYYQDELAFMREMGREFATTYPAAAPFLADRGSDPDVERLLEGFAFLTGRIRQKLDDEFPELTHALMNLLWPHYLRPIPSISMIQFTPIAGAVRERQRVIRGTEVASTPVEGTPCRFRTCFDLDLYPFTLEDARIETLSDGRPTLRIRFAMSPGITLAQVHLKTIRLHLFGEPAYTLYLLLCRPFTSLVEVKVRGILKGKPGSEQLISPSCVKPVGFSRDEALLPYPKTSFDGYRLLQEYFAFPQKFLFVELSDLKPLERLTAGEAFEVDFIFSRLPSTSLRVTRDHVRLYCTPVVNLFPTDSDPLRVSHERVEYRIRPAGSHPTHAEIYSVDRAMGWIRGTAEEREYEPFYSFKHGLGAFGRPTTYYQTRLRNAVVGEGADTYVAFVNGEEENVIPPTETVVFHLTCTNRNLAEKLRVGDIQIPTETSPEFAQFQNIIKVSPTIRPPLGGDIYWRFISHLSLNYISLSDIQAFRGILNLYNLQSLHDQQASRANERRLAGIREIQSEAGNFLLRGVPVRITETSISFMEDHFAEEGDMFLFAGVLNEFLSLYVSLNSYSQLTARGIQRGEIYSWEPKIGQQTLL